MYHICIRKITLNFSHKLYSVPLSKIFWINKYSSNIKFLFPFKQNCSSYDFPIFCIYVYKCPSSNICLCQLIASYCGDPSFSLPPTKISVSKDFLIFPQFFLFHFHCFFLKSYPSLSIPSFTLSVLQIQIFACFQTHQKP